MLVELEPGPIDDSVLTRQASHRSARVWDLNGLEESVVLTCRRRELALSRVVVDRLLPLIEAAGFTGLMKVPFIQLDCHLITALVERWRPETHSFHMPTGETTITLQDVSIQLGLRVDGRPITGRMDYNWPEECDRLLGVKPTGSNLQGGRLTLGWLEKALPNLPDNADDATLRKYARAYILQLMGASIFSDKSSKCLHLMFLPLLEDLDQAGQCSWGSGALGWLYRDLCRATVPTAHEIGGCLILLQVWAWDRFPYIAPLRCNKLPVQSGPLITRWHDVFSVVQVPTHVVVWEPYSPDVVAALPDYCRVGSEVWQAVAPLLCFPVAEWHQPDRVLHEATPNGKGRAKKKVVQDYIFDLEFQGQLVFFKRQWNEELLERVWRP
ncbi:hypothetical protein Vadar_034309 [Vaccinium darrowii]|uniref:Uncharacterized protein n=1 Tax=Vaccinium darrowii TaxID=229202 RepID=A0ACB7Z0X5_9ERIC|nr:hypothetical protein Vadar_034309 [Vaccinium darrowii]